MRKYLFFFCFLLILVLMTSCRPKGVLSREEMTDLLFDVHVTEALVNQNPGPVPDNWRKGLEPDYFRDLSYRSVLRKHKVSEADFYKSVRYYSKDLRLYTRIYADVDKRIKEMTDDVINWKFHTPSAKDFYQHANLDTMKIRRLYYEFQYQPDTSRIKKFNMFAKTIRTWTDLKTMEWLRKKQKKEHFYIINPKDYVKIVNIKKDSTSVHDTLNNKETLLKKDERIVFDKKDVTVVGL
jgi:hypothetical protein